MANTEENTDWEPIGIRWGEVCGHCYPMARHRGLQDLSSLLAAESAIDSLPDDIASADFEPLNPPPAGELPPADDLPSLLPPAVPE